MDRAGILLRASIFRDLSRADVEQLLPDVLERTYARGQTVWIEGDRAETIVVIAEGQLKAHRLSSDGCEVIVNVYGAGEVTGEVGLFHPVGVRWLNLSAMTRTLALMVRRAPLLDFLARHPAAMQRMLEQLSVAAVQVAYSFSGVAFDDIGHRVARLVLHLADEHGEGTPDGVRVRLQLSQGDLAAYVAASRERVNRALAALVTRGVVSQRGGHFYVHDRAALAEAARVGEGDLRRL
jgi:CRP-like cAMP-binding protein